MGCRAELGLRKGAQLSAPHHSIALGSCISTHWGRLLSEFAGVSYGEKIDAQFK